LPDPDAPGKLVLTKYRKGRRVDEAEDEYLALVRQFGLFFRRAERFHHSLHLDGVDRPLERAAYQVLGRIAGGGPARLSALAGDLCVDLSTVSRQVAALEAAGLVRRTADPSDRRASVIEATETGTKIYECNRDTWRAALTGVLADWTPAERREFVRLFARLNHAIAEATATRAATGHYRGQENQ
jgi:DNA-binding MarR family transcriptional regulator